MSDRKLLISHLESLLREHEDILTSLREGGPVSHAPRRLIRINTQIHAAYRRLAHAGALPTRRPFPDRNLEEVTGT